MNYILPDTRFWILLSIAVGTVAVYYFFFYFYKRPRKKKFPSQITQPPGWMSPAAMRYLLQKGVDTKGLMLIVLDASIKGCYKIRWTRNAFLAVRCESMDASLLSPDEKKALSTGKDQYKEKIQMGKIITPSVVKMGDNLNDYFDSTYRKFFNNRRGLWAGGLVLSILFSLGLIVQMGSERMVGHWLEFNIIMAIFMAAPLYFLSIVLRDRYWFGIFFCGVMISIGVIGITWFLQRADGLVISAATFPLLVFPIGFVGRMSVYTKDGQRMVNLIQAYKENLQQRLESAQQNGEDMNRFLPELPYMMAVDVESQYTGYFQPLLSRMQYMPGNMQQYFPFRRKKV